MYKDHDVVINTVAVLLMGPFRLFLIILLCVNRYTYSPKEKVTPYFYIISLGNDEDANPVLN